MPLLLILRLALLPPLLLPLALLLRFLILYV
jgi:hypothetical protein